MRVLFALLCLFLGSPSYSLAVELRQVVNEDGTRYAIDPETHRVFTCITVQEPQNGLSTNPVGFTQYCVSMDNQNALELSHPIQVSQAPTAPHPAGPETRLNSDLSHLGLPNPFTQSLPPNTEWNTAEAMLRSTTVGLGQPNSGYAPSIPLNTSQQAFAMQCFNNIFNGVPVKNYSGIRNEAEQYAANARIFREDAERLKKYKPAPINESDFQVSEEQMRRFREMKIIDLPSIPDPDDSEIPYRFQSQGERREELRRLYKHLYKINPEGGKRLKAKEMGLATVEEADQSFSQGDIEQGNFYKELAEGFLDITIGLDPITGMGRSTYELLLGRNFVTGARLNTLDRSLAFLGVVTVGGSRTAVQAGRGMWKVFARASHLLQDRNAVQAAIREGEILVGRAGHLLDGWRKNHKITNIHTAESVNRVFPAHWSPRPFQAGSHVVEFKTIKETQWIRVHSLGNEPGEWVMRKSAIQGLTPRQIAEKFGLGNRLPTHVSDVVVPKGTVMLRGNIGNQAGKPEGAIQYFLTEVDVTWFKNARQL